MEGGVGGREGVRGNWWSGVREREEVCEGKVKWGWREGMGLEGAESEEGRGRTTRINLKIGPIIENVSHFLLVRVGHFFLIQNNWVFY